MCASWQRGGRHELKQARLLGGVVLALQSAALSEDALLLCDNEAVLCVIKKWVGQGGKATLATAPDAENPARDSVSANATCASGESYFSDKGEVASWRTNQRAG